MHLVPLTAQLSAQQDTILFILHNSHAYVCVTQHSTTGVGRYLAENSPKQAYRLRFFAAFAAWHPALGLAIAGLAQ